MKKKTNQNKTPWSQSRKTVFLLSLSQIYEFVKFQANSKGNIFAFFSSAGSLILVYLFSVLSECSKWGENHDSVFCK